MLETQAKIRQDATAMQDFLKGMREWEDSAKKRDRALLKKRKSKAASSSPAAVAEVAAHSKPPIDADGAGAPTPVPGQPPTVASVRAPKTATVSSSSSSGPAAAPAKAPDVIEREDGNKHYKAGEFTLAIKCYTRAIAINPSGTPIPYSNRAMAYLRLREYTKALDDATLALRLDPKHVKSLLRRGTASNALGRHRSALKDFELASSLEPQNKQVGAELRKTRELRKAAIRRAPRSKVPVTIIA